ncbi:MAG: DNA polymerase III subunit gamma/tau [Dehalococcoidia bacterium]|nr:DNA polymerase III subunit gamma/tau [Dehalococcoidia bacterium]
MSQEVLYRKWRPQRFADVVGQQPITTTLRHAVASGSPAHAYLFTGPRGTGKTSTGRILAKAVNCLEPVEGEPCNTCTSCEAFQSGRALDLIELDAASNRGIDEVRALREAAGYAPNSARYKVYLIDEVHMLTDAAFNALLKTLEEPPPHIIFILATTEAHRIPATITSRCQRFDFRRHTLANTVEWLQVIADGEGMTVAPGCLELIARQATGSMRDAVNLLDQLVAYHGRTLDLDAVQRGLGLVVDHRTTELAGAAVKRDLSAGLAVLAAARDDGLDIRAFAREVVATLRSLLLIRAGATDQLSLSESQTAELREIANEVGSADIVAALRAFGDLDFAGDPYDSLPAEIAFASLAVGLTANTGQPPVAAAPTQPAEGRATRSAPAERRSSSAAPRQGQRARTPQPPQPRPQPVPPIASTPPVEAEREAPPPPFVPPDAADAPPALREIRGKWGGIREAVRKRSHKAGALLNTACDIKSFDGDSVELGFRFPTHVQKAQEDPKVMQAIREAVAEAVGHPVQVVPVVWDAMQQAAAPPPQAQSRGGHLLEEALRYGAVPVDN